MSLVRSLQSRAGGFFIFNLDELAHRKMDRMRYCMLPLFRKYSVY